MDPIGNNEDSLRFSYYPSGQFNKTVGVSPKQLRNFITKVIKDHLEGLREAEEPEKSGAMWSAWRARISLLVFDRQALHAKLPGDPISLCMSKYQCVGIERRFQDKDRSIVPPSGRRCLTSVSRWSR